MYIDLAPSCALSVASERCAIGAGEGGEAILRDAGNGGETNSRDVSVVRVVCARLRSVDSGGADGW